MIVDEIEDEYSGGTIMRDCPDCGQYCKLPDTYTVKYVKGVGMVCVATSYCRRCRETVELRVEFF